MLIGEIQKHINFLKLFIYVTVWKQIQWTTGGASNQFDIIKKNSLSVDLRHSQGIYIFIGVLNYFIGESLQREDKRWRVL